MTETTLSTKPGRPGPLRYVSIFILEHATLCCINQNASDSRQSDALRRELSQESLKLILFIPHLIC